MLTNWRNGQLAWESLTQRVVVVDGESQCFDGLLCVHEWGAVTNKWVVSPANLSEPHDAAADLRRKIELIERAVREKDGGR